MTTEDISITVLGRKVEVLKDGEMDCERGRRAEDETHDVMIVNFDYLCIFLVQIGR